MKHDEACLQADNCVQLSVKQLRINSKKYTTEKKPWKKAVQQNPQQSALKSSLSKIFKHQKN